MSLAESKVIGFVPSTNLDTSQAFYSDVLDLNLSVSDDYALQYSVCGALLRIAEVVDIPDVQYTIFGWQVVDIESTVESLMKRGVRFETFEGLSQNEMGICSFPSGSRVAWFKDPDGNTLSLTQF